MTALTDRLRREGAMAGFDRGMKALDAGQTDKAERLFRQCLKVDDQWLEAWVNLGKALAVTDRFTAATQALARAIKLDPDCGPAHFNLAQLLLAHGDWELGFAEYRWRYLGNINRSRDRRFGRPEWQGETLTGERVLVLFEQGLGDMIQFARYLPRLAERGAQVVLECQPALRHLFAGLPGVVELIEPGEPALNIAKVVTIGDLPGLFGARPDDPPMPAYLTPDPNLVAHWAAKLGPRTGPRVGLVWRGNPAHANDLRRSLPLAILRPGLPPTCDFFSLMPDWPNADANDPSSVPAIRQFGYELTDFGDTAALCTLMDVVVSVDTSVAHLAGALGRPVWIMLPSVADWRWLRGRTDTSWYGSARLFRQKRAGDWTPVVRNLGQALGALA